MFTQVLASQVQTRLRAAFARWGLPALLRLDNGWPWGGWNDLPTALALWLVGLGIDLDFIPKGQKQLNGVVEKSHGTGQRWCEPEKCHSPEQLQEHADEMDHIQRAVYPSCQGRSRLAVYPQLVQPARPYTPQWEQDNWDLRRAQEYLAGFLAVRQASSQGRVWLYAQRYNLGSKNGRQEVLVYYDAGSGEWVFTGRAGQVLRRLQAVQITRERILRLEVSS